jgi:plastocyanin
VTKEGRKPRPLALTLALASLAAVALAMPQSAGAATSVEEFTVGPIDVDAYQVRQGLFPPDIISGIPHPDEPGFITRMEVELVDAEGRKIPIRRLMLHHIVFFNASRPDPTCAEQGFLGWDGVSLLPGRERFFAAGEERMKLVLPPGYGYRHEPGDLWGVNYMLMNHRASADQAFVRYRITFDTDPGLEPVTPYWLDVRNCRADPIYNVPGTGDKGSTHVRSADFQIPEAGRIVAGGGHVHGGARRLTLTQPACGDRMLGESVPTWGLARHPFYHVRPVLHEPGPVEMSGFGTASGIPIAAGETVRLNALYENSRPHVRVMGIMVVFVDPDPSVTAPCGPLPPDLQALRSDRAGRRSPVRFRIPLTGFDERGNAVPISAPPGPVRRLGDGATVDVGDLFFSEPNIRIRRGAHLRWRFGGELLHNLTLANGPVAIGTPNLDGGREFARRFRRAGTYRFFCSLHPVQMSERVIVERHRE